ncbi:MaoC/PaaZ C-terminal domain-containing protein [Actinoplanes sp. NPDC049596]|uniref:MaoC family dehydratase n=1 Tax=unclassified Actinoplanes TaxID=2626549 RepID=UPI0034404418
MMAVEDLSSDPGGNTLRAALGLIPRARRDDLPAVELVRRGVVVDRDHLASYDRVCGFRLSDVLPATYPQVLAFPTVMRLLTAPDFPLPAVGLVHIANRITTTRPLLASDRMDLSVTAADLRPHHRGRQVDIHVSASVEGAEVWSSVSTYLSRSGRPPSSSVAPSSSPAAAPSPAPTPLSAVPASSTVPPPPGPSLSPAPPPASAPSSLASHTSSSALSPAPRPSSSMQPLSSLPAASAVWRVPVSVGGAYAAASGDRNPIHTSRVGARLFGFPRPIAHGMWTLARCLAFFEGRLPPAYIVDVAFRQPILLPGKVSFWADDAGNFGVYGKRPHLAGQLTPA